MSRRRLTGPTLPPGGNPRARTSIGNERCSAEETTTLGQLLPVSCYAFGKHTCAHLYLEHLVFLALCLFVLLMYLSPCDRGMPHVA
jgi:hypothetical protein